MSRNLALALAVASALGASACNALFGVDNYNVATTEGGDDNAGGLGGGVPPLCVPNEVMSCYEGPEGTEDVGSCQSGQKTCNEDGSGVGECIGQSTPVVEDCLSDGDDDCNGLDCLAPIWSRTFSDDAPNTENQAVNDVAASEDEVVVVGTYRSALRIGANLLSGANSTDGFVASFDTLGNLKWRTQIGGANQQVPSAVALDDDGSVYVAGSFREELEAEVTTPNALGWDAFVIKLDPEGTIVWSRTLGSDMNVRAFDIAVSNGNVVIGGDLSGVVEIDNGMMLSAATNDMYALNLDTEGNTMWLAWVSSTNDSRFEAVALSDAHVFLGGRFTGDLTIDGGSISAGTGSDGLALSLTRAGELVGFRHFSGAGEAGVTALAVHGLDIIVVGDVLGTIELGPTSYDSTTSDAFLARYSADFGEASWALGLAGSGQQTVAAVTVDDHGEIALVGTNDGAFDLVPEPITSAGSDDIFVAKFDAEGAGRFAVSYGDANNDSGAGVAVHPSSRDLFIAGTFAGEIVFNTATHTAQANDGILARIAR